VIQRESQKLNKIIDSRYSRISQNQYLLWDLSLPNLGVTPEAAKYWTLRDMRIEQVYSWNEETKNIWENLSLTNSVNGMQVSLSRPPSENRNIQISEISKMNKIYTTIASSNLIFLGSI
jgi:hypothetical protein